MDKRLFVAIPLKENIKIFLHQYKNHFTQENINWTKKENLHITLHFLGNVKDQQIPKLIDKINTALLNIKSFSLQLKGAVLAPPNKIASMVWAQFKKNKDYYQLCFKLHNAIQKFENKKHIETENHKELIPHITLARFKGAVDLAQDYLPKLALQKIQVNSCHLMESKLTPDGPIYSTLATFLLNIV